MRFQGQFSDTVCSKDKFLGDFERPQQCGINATDIHAESVCVYLYLYVDLVPLPTLPVSEAHYFQAAKLKESLSQYTWWSKLNSPEKRYLPLDAKRFACSWLQWKKISFHFICTCHVYDVAGMQSNGRRLDSIKDLKLKRLS